MFPRALATHALTVGFAVLAFSMPLGMTAQLAELPDAPSAVKARQVAQNEDAGTAETSVDLADDSAPTQWRFAFNMEPVGVDQQSLYKPGKQSSGPGFSSSVAEMRPIPGDGPVLSNPCPNNSCSQAQSIMCCRTAPSPFVRYLKSRDAVPLTARDNLRSAVKGVIDPFNLLTIAGDAAIGVASDSHSVYGPGFDGVSKYAGVSLTEDMTGEFFGTFLVPSIMHQDPHYHREPYLPIKRRILHAIVQVVWAQSYTGQPMFNYANIVGGIATAAVSNTFVPGPGRQGFGATSERLAVAFAISPSGNLIEEFLPDIASRINLRVVIFQRILNTVSLEESGVP